MTDNICFIGAGYIGGSTAPVMALHNPDKNFYVVDIDVDRVNAWNSGSLPIFEPGLMEIVEKVRNKNLFFSSNVKAAVEECGIVFIGVNTPTKMHGRGASEASNLMYWEGAAHSIAKYANGPKTVVEKSTLPVNTARAISQLLAREAPQHKFTILSNPEFLAEGTAVRDLTSPDRVLIGSLEDEVSMSKAREVAALYGAWVPAERILTIDLWSSELSKLASNAMLAQRVSSINSLACVCEETGADIASVAKVVGMDSRIGSKFLQAGPGFGGSCFRKDILSLIYICKTLGLNEVAEYWRGVIAMNDYQKRRIIDRILDRSFNTLSNKKVAVLGYAFKADTDDTRDTPARAIVDMLKAERCREIAVYDPKAGDAAAAEVGDASCCKSMSVYDACTGADIAVICTPWDEFKHVDWKQVCSSMVGQKTLFDTRNCLGKGKQHFVDIGFDFISVGH